MAHSPAKVSGSFLGNVAIADAMVPLFVRSSAIFVPYSHPKVSQLWLGNGYMLKTT